MLLILLLQPRDYVFISVCYGGGAVNEKVGGGGLSLLMVIFQIAYSNGLVE